MTVVELLQALNDRARECGLASIEERELRGWVDRKLIRPAKPKGRKRGSHPVWHYDADSVDAASKLVEFKKFGITRTSALLIHLFANGFDFPVEVTRTSLRSEFERLINRSHRREFWDTAPEQVNQLSPAQRKKLSTFGGTRDARLEKTGIPLEPSFFLTHLQNSYWGSSAITDEVRSTLPLFLAGPLTPALLSSPEFHNASVLTLLEDASGQELEEARTALARFYFDFAFSVGAFGFRDADADDLIASVAHDEWLVLTLAAMVGEARSRRGS